VLVFDNTVVCKILEKLLFIKQFFENRIFIFCSKFKNKLRIIPALAEEQNLKFSNVVNKTAASAAQFAKCVLLYAYSCTTADPSCTSTKQKLHIAYLKSWHNNIFGHKLRIIEAENP